MSPPKITKWVLSPHALARVIERKISASELTLVIDEPSDTIPQGPKWIFAKEIIGRTDNKIAAVLLEKEDRGLWVVVTVMVQFKEK